MLARWILAALCAVGVIAQQAAPQEPKLIPFHGRVIDAATRQGLQGAVVELRSTANNTTGEAAPTFSAKTDAKGDFEILAAAGARTLYVSLEGYAAADRGAVSVTLSEQSRPDAVTFLMEPAGSVSGIAEDADGKPIAGIAVEMIDPLSMARSASLRSVTGADGRFSIKAVRPGSYFLRGLVQQPSQGRLEQAPQAFALTYYPSSPDGWGAAQITVYAGVEVPNVRLRMQKAEFYTISGRVLNQGSNVVKATRVRLWREDNPRVSLSISTAEARIEAPIAADGTFRIERVLPGAYTASAQSDVKILLPVASVPVKISNHDEDDLRLTVQPGGKFSGKIVLEEGEPLGLKQISVAARLGASEITVEIPVASDGSFSFDGLPATTYRLNLRGFVVGKIETGGRTFNGSKFEFLPPGSEALITASKTGGSVQGSLAGTRKSDEVVTGVASAALVTGFTDRTFVNKTAPLSKDGNFQITGLEPGSYLVCAWTDLALTVTQFLMSAMAPVDELKQQCQEVTLKAHGAESVRVPQLSIERLMR